MTALAGKTADGWLRFDSTSPVDISIPLHFGGRQPNHFGAARATATPMRAGSFVGDTRHGGSCNAMQVVLNPHCNGTHTECIGHVTDDRVAVAEQARNLLCRAQLVTVTPAACEATDSSSADERVIDRDSLAQACGGVDPRTRALIVRTLPNDSAKKEKAYGDSADSPWFTPGAARLLVETGIEHLLIDTPSLDRLHDGGALAAHRVFWGLPPASRSLAEAGRPHATITEMIYVPDNVADGAYVLNLQIPPFMLDAAPSRPLLYALHPEVAA